MIRNEDTVSTGIYVTYPFSSPKDEIKFRESR